MNRRVARFGSLTPLTLVLVAGGVFAVTSANAQDRNSHDGAGGPATHASLISESQLPSHALFTQGATRKLRIISEGPIGIANPTARFTRLEWSYVAEGTAIENAPAGDGQSVDPPMNFPPSLNSLFTTLGSPAPVGFGNQRDWQTIVSDAFDRWEAVCGVVFEFTGGPEPIADDPNEDSGDRWDQFAPRWPETTTTGIGDIRIAMRRLDGRYESDGSGGGNLAYTYDPHILPPPDEEDITDPLEPITNLGYAGNILLDMDELWTDPATPNLFQVVIAREIGRAIGLAPACPNPDFSTPASIQATVFALMQNQDVSLPGGSGVPLPQLLILTPQQDDILAAQYAYGDPFEFNDTLAFPSTITYAPPAGSSTFTFAPHLVGQPFATPFQLSISGRGPGAAGGEAVLPTIVPGTLDVDIFRLSLPQSVVTAVLSVTVQPVGTPYIDGQYVLSSRSCDAATVAVDPRTNQNLSFTIRQFNPISNAFTTVSTQNLTGVGEAETVSVNVTSGTFYVTVSGDGSDNVQMYDLTVTVETPSNLSGEPFVPVLATLGIDAFEEIGATGFDVAYGSLDGQHVAAHEVFDGRDILKISWPGVQPAVTTAASHPTSVAAVAAGDFASNFRGLARDAEVISAAIATDVFADGTFSVGKNSLYYGLFGMADRSLSQSLGLQQPVSVISSAWAAGARPRNGEDAVSQALDAVVSMTGVTMVVAAGNDGQAERQGFTNCPNTEPDSESPGVQFLGSRSVVPPATAFNIISVGATGTSDGTNFDIVAGFSSRGPIDSNNYAAMADDVLRVRSGVDIVAPGTGFTIIPPDFNPPQGDPPDPCTYIGPIPQSFLTLPAISATDDPNQPASPDFQQPVQGTSVAAGIVAGAVALLQDAARAQDPPLATHPAVMKAILLNGADKLAGWSNTFEGPGKPQDQRDGFITGPDEEVFNILSPTRPLDSTQGAGQLNLRRSLENYLTGYAPATPPQANFDGPTIDPSETDPAVPTIRMLDQTGGAGGPGSALRGPSSTPEANGQTSVPPSAIELATKFRRARGGAEAGESWSGRPLQQGRDDADLKQGRGGPGDVVATTPQVPFIIPSLGGGPGNPTNPPPTSDEGVAPRQIEPIFVDPIGWDYANIDQFSFIPAGETTRVRDGYIDYVINVPLLTVRPDPANPGAFLDADRVTVTLCWNRDFVLDTVNFDNPNDPRIGSVSKLRFENLDLQVFIADGLGNPTGSSFRNSLSTWGNTEHQSFRMVRDGILLIRVQWSGNNYDVLNNTPLAEQPFAIAWRVDFSDRPVSSRPTGITDLVDVLQSYGAVIGTRSPAPYAMTADMNKDGKINFDDIRAVLANWR